MYFKDKTTIC